MPPIVSTDWRRCIFPPNQLFLYFTTTKVIEKASNYKVLFNNVYRLAAAPLNCCKLRATRLASGIVQLLFSGFCVSFLFIFPTRDASPPLEVALVGSVWCLSTVLLAIICKCTNTADAAALLFATLRRQSISILAYCHISTLPCSHHFALNLSASWSSYCFCRRTSSFIKRAVIFSVPGWP